LLNLQAGRGPNFLAQPHDGAIIVGHAALDAFPALTCSPVPLCASTSAKVLVVSMWKDMEGLEMNDRIRFACLAYQGSGLQGVMRTHVKLV
jgi:hypothetical protein